MRRIGIHQLEPGLEGHLPRVIGGKVVWSDIAEHIRDTIVGFLVEGANVTFTHDDVGETFTIEASSDSGTPGVLLIENGAEVPPDTPPGTLIFEKG